MPPHPQPSNVERNAIVGCCVLSLLLFFFPLLTIHVPIAGEQDVSGYDVFSKLPEFREKLKTRRHEAESDLRKAEKENQELKRQLEESSRTP